MKRTYIIQLPYEVSRQIKPVYDRDTGELVYLRLLIDFVPDRIKGIEAGKTVQVTIKEWKPSR